MNNKIVYTSTIPQKFHQQGFHLPAMNLLYAHRAMSATPPTSSKLLPPIGSLDGTVTVNSCIYIAQGKQTQECKGTLSYKSHS